MTDPGQSDRTLLDALKRHLQDRPDTPAYRWGTRTWTFRDLERDTNRIANLLVKQGIGRGDRVACLTKHHIPCILLTLAALKVGAVCMPVNWRLAPPEAEYIVGHGQSRLLLVDDAFARPFLPGGSVKLPPNCTVVCTEKSMADAPGFEEWYASGATEFQAVPADTDDAALQLYSSGTTGLPKGVVLTHRGLLSTSRVVSNDWHFGAGNVLGNPLPTFHVAGMTMLLLTLYTGGATSAYSDFDPAGFIDSIVTHGITHSFLVPAMLLFMLQSPAAPKGDYTSLQVIAYGGSPISETVLQQAMSVFQCDFVQVYGLTEVSGPATFLSQDDHRRAAKEPSLLRSAGRPIGNCRLRIVDPVSGKDLPEGQTGEVWLETVRNLKEYWRDPEATRRAFPDGRNERGGWFRTGDGGYVKDGYLYINDRIKDMIISGGENIYPAEIENLLMKHPAVADGAIIGVPDPVWGEAVKACVVLKPGAKATDREIIDWMRERLAHYKCPKTVDLIEALPRNPSGKILKRILREPYWQGQQRAVH
ncbi:MAG TPA: long-chain-fatty-acid--CoA ligase [Ramlibacter sp.]|nr:long-chain-fatty-acid--CoA ligase [Ramlibacter sp.]